MSPSEQKVGRLTTLEDTVSLQSREQACLLPTIQHPRSLSTAPQHMQLSPDLSLVTLRELGLEESAQ